MKVIGPFKCVRAKFYCCFWKRINYGKRVNLDSRSTGCLARLRSLASLWRGNTSGEWSRHCDSHASLFSFSWQTRMNRVRLSQRQYGWDGLRVDSGECVFNNDGRSNREFFTWKVWRDPSQAQASPLWWIPCISGGGNFLKLGFAFEGFFKQILDQCWNSNYNNNHIDQKALDSWRLENKVSVTDLVNCK